jgi:hypothetical protein
LLALLILAFVLSNLPWKDTLSLVREDQDTLTITGELSGNWRGNEVEFQPAEDADVDGWPLPVLESLHAGLPVERRPAGNFEWQPGMPRVFSEIELGGLLPAMLLVLIGPLIFASARWWRLLALAGCATRYLEALRLTLLALFFNLVMPGLTGGDVVKAVLVVRQHPDRRADALVTVIVDRAIGLVVLVGLACGVVLVSGSRFAVLKPFVTGAFLLLVAGLWVLMHPGARRLFRFDAIIARLPQRERLEKVNTALQIYAKRPGELALAVLLTLVNHLSIGGAVYFLGRAYGERLLSYLDYLAIASVANTISAVPLSPSGWGVGELAYSKLFVMIEADPTVGVAVSITFRLLMMALGLMGGLLLLLPGGRDVRSELDEAKGAEAEAG